MLLIKIEVIQYHKMKLNFNQYTMEYLKLMIEAQEVDFKSNIYRRLRFKIIEFCVCKLRKFIKALDSKSVNSRLNTHDFDIGLIRVFQTMCVCVYEFLK